MGALVFAAAECWLIMLKSLALEFSTLDLMSVAGGYW
jgi:hypothetical protein